VIPVQTSPSSSSWLRPLLFILNDDWMLLISFSCLLLPSPSILQQHHPLHVSHQQQEKLLLQNPLQEMHGHDAGLVEASMEQNQQEC
jgi:hypothetical protein